MSAICAAILAQTDDNIIKVQKRLQAEGCYFGNATGLLDLDTRNALTRYQIRHGLVVTGKLDAPTARQLKVAVSDPPVAQTPAPQTQSAPRMLTGGWRRLPTGEMEFVEEQPAAPSPAAPVATAPVPPPPAEGPKAPLEENRSQRFFIRTNPNWHIDKRNAPHSSPPSSQNAPPAVSSTPPSGSAGGIVSAENLRNFVEAFIQAGLALPFGSEIKFFAEHVDYLGTPGLPRPDIQRDLVRYDRKWPHRRFWIDGDIRIEQPGGNEIKVVFPLRYELQNGSRHASGKVLKALTLLKTANNELQIVAVSESAAP